MMEENTQTAETSADVEIQQETCESLRAERDEYRDKHLRLYAEFENYRKKALKDKDEVLKYANESMIYELLPVMDSLDMALQHASTGNSDALTALAKGVENTLREMNRTLEKFGLTQIEAAGKAFDPSVHHAMSQVERNDMDENMVVQELRKGYMYKEKVLRATLVTVSKKASQNNGD
ncbi:MAG: nucleotide exchange factor GrpE [Nitrospirae bacterium]|nr:MAG: nucleotide exchange factor GrpE [Nitrospirota bacterium]